MIKKHNFLEKKAYIQSEIVSIINIYRLIYAKKNLRFLLCEQNTTFYGNPKIEYFKHGIEYTNTGDKYLGFEDFIQVEKPDIDYCVKIDIAHSVVFNDVRHSNPLRRFVKRILINKFPLLFEYLKYIYVNRQTKRIQSNLDWIKLPKNRINYFDLNVPVLSDKPAILIAMHWLETGGAESFGFDTIKVALKLGYRVIIVAEKPSAHEKLSSLPDSPDVTFIPIDRYLEPNKWPLYLEALIKSQNIIAIHIHHNVSVYESLAHIKAICPWVVIVDTTHIIERYDAGFPRISCVWSKYIDHHHVISDELKRFYRNKFYVNRKVVLGRLLPAKYVAPVDFRLNINPKKLALVFIGRMIHQKRPYLLVAIAKNLNTWAVKNNIEISFDFVGEGPYRQQMEKLIACENLSDCVQFHNAGTDVPKLLASSDILLLPSDNEGLALVCYEAIQHGVIPISTDVGGQGELLPPALLVDRQPYKTVAQTIKIVKKISQDDVYLRDVKTQLIKKYELLSKQPTGEQVVEDIYTNVLNGYKND